MNEIWKPVNGYEGRYEISSLGRLRTYAQDRKNGKIKIGNLNAHGYLTIVLYDGKGNKETYLMHRLVAQTFISNPLNLPQVNHKDEDKTNNRVDNLEWCTNDYNIHYGTKIERTRQANMCCRSTSVGVFSIDRDGSFTFYDSIGDAERKTGLAHSNIVRALKGRRPRCGGCYWYYSYEPPRTSPTTTERRDAEQSAMQQSALAR